MTKVVIYCIYLNFLRNTVRIKSCVLNADCWCSLLHWRNITVQHKLVQPLNYLLSMTHEHTHTHTRLLGMHPSIHPSGKLSRDVDLNPFALSHDPRHNHTPSHAMLKCGNIKGRKNIVSFTATHFLLHSISHLQPGAIREALKRSRLTTRPINKLGRSIFPHVYADGSVPFERLPAFGLAV